MIDSNIIKRCQQGDETAYDELYKLTGKKALWTAYLIAGHMDIVEDIIQEAFFECFRCIKKLRKPELFPVWFNRLLIRTSWRIVLNEKKKATRSYDDDLLAELEDDNREYEKIEETQTKLIIRKAINKLNPIMHTVVILYYYNNLSIKEIAKVMNCFEGTVKSRLYYAKKALEKELKFELAEDSFIDSNYTERKCMLNETK